jgi:hypothetical protein
VRLAGRGVCVCVDAGLHEFRKFLHEVRRLLHEVCTVGYYMRLVSVRCLDGARRRYVDSH